MNPTEYDYEPVRGLPGQLPSGERLLWQGTPQGWAMARGALRVPFVAGYFGVIALWQAGSTWLAGQSFGAVLHALTVPLLLGALACAVLCAIAWGAARATVYTITSRRIVIRHGIALPMSLNLPFAQIDAAGLKMRRNGTGDLAIRLASTQRVGYLLNWPHVRPGHYLHPQPALRGLPDAERAAQVLAAALRDSAEQVATSGATAANQAPATLVPAASPSPARHAASTATVAA